MAAYKCSPRGGCLEVPPLQRRRLPTLRAVLSAHSWLDGRPPAPQQAAAARPSGCWLPHATQTIDAAQPNARFLAAPFSCLPIKQSSNHNTRRAPPISSPCFSSILSLVNGVCCSALPWHVCRGWLLRTTRQARRPCVPAWCCCCCVRLCTLEPPAFLSPARLLSIPLPLLSASLSHHTITSYWQGLVLLLFCW